jgi:type III secretory pathway component EscS
MKILEVQVVHSIFSRSLIQIQEKTIQFREKAVTISANRLVHHHELFSIVSCV